MLPKNAIGISRGNIEKKGACIEGRKAYVSPSCSNSLCTQDCKLAGVYRIGKCEVERSAPVCRCHGCKRA